MARSISRDGKYAAGSFIAYEGSGFGVWVSSQDVDGDGMAEILADPCPDPRSNATVRILWRDGTPVGEFKAYPDFMKFGIRVFKGTVEKKERA
jgi:hypothetical protein